MRENRVLFLTNLPSPYIVDFLNELGRMCNLTAIFERANSNVRDDSWRNYKFDNFEGIILNGKKIKVNENLDDQAICPQIIFYLKKDFYDSIIVANPCTPTGIIAILYMKIRGIPFTIQSEGGFPGVGNGLKETIKRIIMKNADMYLSTAELGDKYFIKYGADEKRIYRFPFSSLHSNEVLKEVVDIEEKKEIKKTLGIPYNRIVISVGRFIKLKGFEGLMKSFQGIDDDIGLYIIGGKPTNEYLDLCSMLGLKNVHFVDFQDRGSMNQYYKSADIFALNTHNDTWGLVINEAMSFGLPVISTNKCYAAVALINNAENGFLVEPDDVEALHNSITKLLEDDCLREKISVNNIIKSKKYTVEEMANKIYSNIRAHQSSWGIGNRINNLK